MLSMDIERALVHLYQAEMRLNRLKQERAPAQIISKTKDRLHQRWEEARRMGITEELLSKFGWALFVEDVSISLDHRLRDECECHAEHEGRGGDEHVPCAHAQTSASCSPFCPHFKPLVPHSDLSGLAGQD